MQETVTLLLSLRRVRSGCGEPLGTALGPLAWWSGGKMEMDPVFVKVVVVGRPPGHVYQVWGYLYHGEQ